MQALPVSGACQECKDLLRGGFVILRCSCSGPHATVNVRLAHVSSNHNMHMQIGCSTMRT